MSEIKNCPFCGSSASVESNFGKEWWVQCDDLENCSASDNVLCSNAHEATERWNRRAPVASAPTAQADPPAWSFKLDHAPKTIFTVSRDGVLKMGEHITPRDVVEAIEQQWSITRTNIPPMGDELGRQWYFDCDGHYIDVQRDKNGKYSIFFRDRATNTEAWLDQAGGGS